MEKREIIVSNGSRRAKIIFTSAGPVRVGGYPCVTAYIEEKGIQPVATVLPPPDTVDRYGSPWGGEEFQFWNSIFSTGKSLHYIAPPEVLAEFYQVMEFTVPYDLDSARMRIRKRDWLDKTFLPYGVPWNEEGIYNSLSVFYDRGGVELRDTKGIYYVSWSELTLRERTQRCYTEIEWPADGIGCYVYGAGDGFSKNTASFVVGNRDCYYWIDPPGSVWERGFLPTDKLGGIILSHNHEDHIGGFVPLLFQHIEEEKKLKVFTGKKIFETLQKQLFMIPKEVWSRVEFNDISPESSPTELEGGITIETRWNHHCLPSGTLGFKFYGGARGVGISGDTCSREEILSELGDPKLEPGWFEGVSVLMHEVARRTEYSVHTFPEDIRSIRDRLRDTKVICYHIDQVPPDLVLAKEGELYY